MDSKNSPTQALSETQTRTWPGARFAARSTRRLSFWRRHRFSLAGLIVGAAILGVGAFVVHDLRLTQTQVQQLYADSVRGLDRLGELQYQVQEGRRLALLALTTRDPKSRVEYAEQSRAADARVAGLFQPRLAGN